MKNSCKTRWTGNGLIVAGAIVFMVGLTIVLFKEFQIPRTWIPVAVGVALMVAGLAARWLKGLWNSRES